MGSDINFSSRVWSKCVVLFHSSVTKFRTLTWEPKLYCIGVLLLAISGVGALVQQIEVAITVLHVSAFVFSCGLLPYLERLYEKIWRRVFGKVIIAGLLALATNIAHGIGRQVVASIIGANPSSFPSTVSMATILLAPLMILVAMIFVGVVVFIGALCVGMPLVFIFPPSLNHANGRRSIQWICRVVALSLAVGSAVAAFNHPEKNLYRDWVTRRVEDYLYAYDLYDVDNDFPFNSGKTAMLVDGRHLVGKKKSGGGYTFLIQAEKPVGNIRKSGTAKVK